MQALLPPRITCIRFWPLIAEPPLPGWHLLQGVAVSLKERQCVRATAAAAIGVASSKESRGRSPRGLHQAVINVALN